MENEEHVISIGEIFRVIFKRVWWVIGVTVAFLLIFVFVVQFWYNKNNQTYTVGYEIYFPGMDKGQYPDGTQYRLDNVTSVETLTEIRESNKEFDGINVEEMVEKDEIKISQMAVSATDSDTGVAQSYITLTVSVKYFKDNDQAAAFMRAVAAYPVTYALEIVETLDHYYNLRTYDADYTDTLKKKIDLLKAQREYLTGGYKIISDEVGPSYMVNGLTIAEYSNAAAAIFDDDVIERLKDEIKAKNYSETDILDYDKQVENINNQIKLQEEQIELNNKIISALESKWQELLNNLNGLDKNVISDLSNAYTTDINEYTIQNEKLLDSIDKLNARISSQETFQQDINAILSKLDSYSDQLNEATALYTTAYKQFFNETCTVSFRSNKIEAEGGINIILAALIGAVIGFVIVSIVIYIVDMPKYRRQKAAALESAQKSEETPSQEPEADENK